jgi:large subunit ribosomal protein L27
MSHVKSAGTIRVSGNVAGKRLGVKKYAGEFVRTGNILVKQRGTVYHAGKGTKLSRDHSIYAVIDGFVKFRRMTGFKKGQYWIDVVPKESK